MFQSYKKIGSKNGGLPYVKSPPYSNIAQMQNYNNMIWHLSRKHTGDLFQGDLTKNLIAYIGDAPLREYCFKNPHNGNLIYPDMDASPGGLEYCRPWFESR